MQRLRHCRSHLDLHQCGVYVPDENLYRSQWYQGLDVGMEWLRLSLYGAENALVRVYVSEESPDVWDETAQPVLEQRAEDLLLYGVYGRYLCFSVTPAHGLRGYDLSFPGNSIDAGLPFVLQGDETFRRMLGVYQSLYMDLNQEFSGFSHRLDPLDSQALPRLDRWVGASRWMRKASEKLRPRLIAAAPMLNRMRGTRRGLELLIELAAGERGILVESFAWKQYITDMEERKECRRLYGESDTQITVLLPQKTEEGAAAFLRDVMEDFLPMGVQGTLIVLEDGSDMDEYCYLDKNAVLVEPSLPVIEGAVLEDVILE